MKTCRRVKYTSAYGIHGEHFQTVQPLAVWGSARGEGERSAAGHLTQELEPESAGLLPGYFHISSIMGLPKSVDLVQRLTPRTSARRSSG